MGGIATNEGMAGAAPIRARRLSAAGALGVVVFMAIIALAIVELWMIAKTLDRPSDQWGPRGYEAVMAASYAVVGLILTVARPRNPISWLLLTVGLVIAVQGVAVQYAVFADMASPPLPWGDFGLWLSTWTWVVIIVLFLGIFPLIFPDGRLLSRRWRLAAALALVALAVQVGDVILNTHPFGPLPPSNSPVPYFALGIRGLVGYIVIWISAAVSTSALVIRYRRADADGRQQIKWVLYATVLAVLAAVVGMTPFVLGQILFIAAGTFAAFAIATAVLRYRLYEIDIIINRTLVDGLLSAILAGLFTASITLS